MGTILVEVEPDKVTEQLVRLNPALPGLMAEFKPLNRLIWTLSWKEAAKMLKLRLKLNFQPLNPRCVLTAVEWARAVPWQIGLCGEPK
jgi:hypothetical protein